MYMYVYICKKKYQYMNIKNTVNCTCICTYILQILSLYMSYSLMSGRYIYVYQLWNDRWDKKWLKMGWGRMLGLKNTSQQRLLI